MSENYFDYSNERDWQEGGNYYYQRFIEPDIKADAVSEIVSWANESQYNLSVIADYFNIEYDDERELSPGKISNNLYDNYETEDLLKFAIDNNIDFDVSYMVSIDNGEFTIFKASILDSKDIMMEEACISLEKSGYNIRYQSHKANIIGPNGTESSGKIMKNGYEEKNPNTRNEPIKES